MNDFAQPLPDGSLLEMVFVPGGTYDMGGSDEEAGADEKPVHAVHIPPFFIGRYPLTQAAWTAVMGGDNNPAYFKGARRPMEQVSWLDAAVFCNVLNRTSGKEPCYFGDAGFKKPLGESGNGWELPNEGAVFFKAGTGGHRLPSEAEWEYAARGGPYWKSAGYRYAGSDLLKQVGWYGENSAAQTRDAGMLLSNALGLYDMSGNVWEWCADHWHANYKNAPNDGSAWINLGQSAPRLFRGGGWADSPQLCRVAYRFHAGPTYRRIDLGFRLALSTQSVK